MPPPEKPEPEDLEDYSKLREYFSPTASLAAIDDVANWLVGLSAVIAAVDSTLRVTANVSAHGRDLLTVAVILYVASVVSAVLARMPLPVTINRRSRVQMLRTTKRLGILRGLLVMLATGLFSSALILSGIAPLS